MSFATADHGCTGSGLNDGKRSGKTPGLFDILKETVMPKPNYKAKPTYKIGDFVVLSPVSPERPLPTGDARSSASCRTTMDMYSTVFGSRPKTSSAG
ncbi:hypothetical protein AJ87_28215 [Rhizobium yanglingense]|nr:hypothetical protein AJ87_28215 [Rhizobium yanglingense]